MKRDYYGYLKSILEKFSNYAGINDDLNVFIMKYYSAYDVKGKLVDEKLLKKHSDLKFYIYSFKSDIMQGVFNPILNFLSSYFESKNDDELRDILIQAGVYPLVVPMFVSYFKNGTLKRTEPILDNEMIYDKRRVMDSIINLLSYVSKDKKTVIVLEKLNYAQYSTIQLLCELIRKNSLSNILFIVTYNDYYKTPAHIRSIWKKFTKLSETLKICVDFDLDENQILEQGNEIFIPSTRKINEYIKKINNMTSALELEQAGYYLEKLYHKFEHEKNKISINDKIELFKCYVINCFYLRDTKKANVICDKIKDIGEQTKDNKIMFEYYYILTKLTILNQQKELADEYVKKCFEIADKMNDSKMYFYSNTLMYYVMFYGFKNIDLFIEDVKIKEEYFVEAKNNKFYNFISYLYFFGYSKLDMLRTKIRDENGLIGCENSSTFKEGYKYSDITGNKEVQLKAWEKNVTIASCVGSFDKIVFYYQKCLELLDGEQRDIDVGMIYNGLGYNCIVNDHFIDARDYFAKAIKIFSSTEYPMLLCETLYNLSINAIVIKDYISASKCVIHTIDLIEKQQVEKLRVCNISKIYGILAFSYIKLNDIYKARVIFDKMRLVLRHLVDTDDENPEYSYWDDDMFVYCLVRGMLKSIDGDYDAALQSYNKAKFHYMRQTGNQFYIYPELISEEYNLNIKMGKIDAAKRVIRLGVETLRKQGHCYKADELESIVNKSKFSSIKIESLDDCIDFNKIQELSELIGIETSQKKMKKSLGFLESWVDLLNRDNDSYDSLIENAMTTIKNNFCIDHLIYIENHQGKTCIKYCDDNKSVSLEQAKQIVTYFKKYPNKIVLCRFENSFDKYEKLVDIFGKNKIFSLMGIPININGESDNILIAIKSCHINFTDNLVRFTDDELDILRSSFRQLIDAIGKEVIKKKLETSSITDTLTGLLNRQGLKKVLDNKLEANSIINDESNFTIVYLDLDNFKYCNDTFGHDVGDVVLVEFSRLLTKVVGKGGYIIRYGGDEFLIVMPNAYKENGVSVSRRIINVVHENAGFREDIEKKLGRQIDIEDKCRVSCSIGIASDRCIKYNDVMNLIVRSDQALYKVKSSTKNDYCVYEE